MSGWPPGPEEAARLREGVPVHPFDSGTRGFAHFACIHLVERDDAGEDCGLPADDPIHFAAGAPRSVAGRIGAARAARPQGTVRDALRLQVWKAVTASGGVANDDRIDYATDCIIGLVRPAWAPAQPSTSGAVWVPEPLPPLPHDWRHGEIDTAGRVTRVAVSVCWACDAVAWNEPDFLALDSRPCPGHPEVALVREAFAAHPEWFASDSARRQITELLKVPT